MATDRNWSLPELLAARPELLERLGPEAQGCASLAELAERQGRSIEELEALIGEPPVWRWRWVFWTAAGILLGLGSATFRYAEGLSYLSTDPAACVNCHIMRPQYESWQKSSHHTVAGCVDCHLPQAFVSKYLAKAENGWFHSKGFTLQDFPEPILITEKNSAILQQNCLNCHSSLIHEAAISSVEGAPRCVRCHVTVGHGEPLGLGGPLKALEHP